MKTFFKVLFCLFLMTSCGNVNKKEKVPAIKDTKAEKITNDSIDLVVKNHKKDFYDFWINMSKLEFYHVSKKLAKEQNRDFNSDYGYFDLKFEMQNGDIEPFAINSGSTERAGQITFQDDFATALLSYKPIFQNNKLKSIQLNFPPVCKFFYHKSADVIANSNVDSPKLTCYTNGSPIIRIYSSKYGKPNVNIKTNENKKYTIYKWIKGEIQIKIIVEYEYSTIRYKIGSGIDSRYKTRLLDGCVTDIKIIYAENEYLRNMDRKKIEEENKLKSLKNRELEDVKSNI